MTDGCPLVLVRWLDSRQPVASWRFLAGIELQGPVECATVGWLIGDTADAKTVCQSVGDLGHPDNAQASGVMTIPARCIISIERLVEEDAVTSASPSCREPALQPTPLPTSQVSECSDPAVHCQGAPAPPAVLCVTCGFYLLLHLLRIMVSPASRVIKGLPTGVDPTFALQEIAKMAARAWDSSDHVVELVE